MNIVREVLRHGGISRVHTHPVTRFDRRSGAYIRAGWANTIVCRDGWRRMLSDSEERALKALPEDAKAEEQHVHER